MMKKNKKGQAVIIGIMVLVLAAILFIAMLPAMSSIADSVRGCEYLNCAGYIDKDARGGNACTAQNQSYHSGFEQNGLGCTVLDLWIPYLILAVLIGLVAKFVAGKLSMDEEPQRPAYPGY